MLHARSSHALHSALIALAVLGLGACGGEADDAPPNMPPAGGTTGGDGTTFNHDNSAINIWDYIDRLNKEGPLTFTSRMHSCSWIPTAS